MTRVELVLLLGAALAVLGLVRVLLAGELVPRIVALNIASGGVMLLLLGFAQRDDGAGEPDPVPQALVLTGIVIMVAVTGLALGLSRRIEAHRDRAEERDDDQTTREGDHGTTPGGMRETP